MNFVTLLVGCFDGGGVGKSTYSLTVKVANKNPENKPMVGAEVVVIADQKTASENTNNNKGLVKFNGLRDGAEVKVSALSINKETLAVVISKDETRTKDLSYTNKVNLISNEDDLKDASEDEEITVVVFSLQLIRMSR